MKPFHCLVLCLVLVCGCGRDRSSQTHTIYEGDSRLDLYQYAEESVLRHYASGVGLIIPKDKLVIVDSMTYRIEAETLREKFAGLGENLVDEEPFLNQPSVVAMGSGFLIGESTVLTAAHVMSTHEQCLNSVIVFDFEKATPWYSSVMVKTENIYACKKILASQLQYEKNDVLHRNVPVYDQTTFEIERQAKSDRHIFEFASERPEGKNLVLIGHPLGLPKKIATDGVLRWDSAAGKRFFVASLDAFAGNSGSPVLDIANGNVFGILVSGESDVTIVDGADFEDYDKQVWASKRCPQFESSSDPQSWQCSGENVVRYEAGL